MKLHVTILSRLIVITPLFCIQSVLGGPVLLGGTWDGVIFDVDPATGATGNPRDTGLGSLSGLAFASNGTLYAIAPIYRQGWDYDGDLYTVDPLTGVSNFVARVSDFAGEIAFDATTGLLVGVYDGRLISIDPLNGNPIELTSVKQAASAIAVDSVGRLFVLNTLNYDDTLQELERASGNVSAEWVLGANLGIAGMAFGTSGQLFVVDLSAPPGAAPPGTNTFYEFDFGAAGLQPLGPNLDRIVTLAYIPEPTTILLVAGALLFVTRKKNRRASYGCFGILFDLCLLTSSLSAQKPGANGGTAQGSLPETGLGTDETLIYSALLHGDFKVAGTSTRSCNLFCSQVTGDPCVCASVLQSDPISLGITGIPAGATVVKAFANWSYVTDNPGHEAEKSIVINSVSVSGSLSGQANNVCQPVPGVVPRRDFLYTAAYTADITGIVVDMGGNGSYTIYGALDEPTSGGLGEGISLLVLFAQPSEPLRIINIWSGLVSTESPATIPIATAMLNFRGPASGCAFYWNEAMHLFVNALDGQLEPRDTWRLNSISADGFPGTQNNSPLDTWVGLLGPNANSNLYDHADGDASLFVMSLDGSILVETERCLVCSCHCDCIGHSFAAIAFEHPLPDVFLPTCEPMEPGSPGDCDSDSASDQCELLCGTPDCNENSVPDECEPQDDCNGNLIQDICDIASGFSDDCNQNGVPDSCDLTSGVNQDCNADDIPDECERDAPTVPSGEPGYSKNRYLSFVPGSPGINTALRVTLVHAPASPGSVGASWWVGPPQRVCENSGQIMPQPNSPPNYGCSSVPGLTVRFMWTARLQCAPYYADWTALIGSPTAFHVYGPEVVTEKCPTSDPSGCDLPVYEVQVIVEGCNIENPDAYSEPLALFVSRWGDIVGYKPANEPWTAPNGYVDIIDATAIIDKFTNELDAPIKSRADIDPEIVNRLVEIADANRCLNAFSGFPYPFSDPPICASGGGGGGGGTGD